MVFPSTMLLLVLQGLLLASQMSCLAASQIVRLQHHQDDGQTQSTHNEVTIDARGHTQATAASHSGGANAMNITLDEVDKIKASFISTSGGTQLDAQGPDLTVGAEAGQILSSTDSGGLVSAPRKMATINLALKALSVPGDFVETGVFNGGTAVLIAKVLKLKDEGKSRSFWAADSFAGLPAESQTGTAVEHDGKAAGTTDIDGAEAVSGSVGFQGEYSSSRLVFERNLETNGLGNSTTNDKIKVLQGWFNETLPNAPIQQIAFLRLDGDIYVSTMDALTGLYAKVVPGGYIYVDDYGAYVGCKNAVDDFRKEHSISETMYSIPEASGKFEALWWQKENA